MHVKKTLQNLYTIFLLIIKNQVRVYLKLFKKAYKIYKIH